MAKKIGIVTVFEKTKNMSIYCMNYLEKYVFVFFSLHFTSDLLFISYEQVKIQLIGK